MLMGEKAFLVGINEYATINGLLGCINDVKDMANTLVICVVVSIEEFNRPSGVLVPR
jgi:hypothetical protein